MGGSIGARPGEVAHDRSGGGGLGAGPVGVVAAFPGGPRPQGAAALGAGVRARPAGSRRAQERAADGGAGRAGGLRPAAPLHPQPGLADRPARGGGWARGGPPRRRAGGGADHRRHRAAQEGRALGRGRPALRRRAGQDGELPGPGLARPGPRRGAGARGAAALSAQDLVPGSETLRQGGCAGGLPPLPQQGGDRTRRARPAPGGRGARFGCALADAGYGSSAAFRRGLAARAPLWAVGIPKTQGVYSAAVTLSWPAAQGTGRPRRPAWGPEPAAGHGRSRPEASALAPDQLAARQQGPAHGQLRRPAGAGGPTPPVADPGPPALGGGVGGRRAAQRRRAEVLPRQPSRRDAPADPRGDDQGPLDLRAGAPADEGGARPRPLRGTVLGRAAPSRPDGADRLRLPAAPAAPAEWPAGEKSAPPARHPTRPCPPFVRRALPASPPPSGCDVPDAARSSSCTGSNESAEVVLVVREEASARRRSAGFAPDASIRFR